MKLSIIIPVYNAEKTIFHLVEQLVLELSQHDLEIVLVNDGSADKSEDLCIQLFEKNKKVVCFLSLAKNVGEHNAVMAGLNMSTGDYVIIMDDDFQNPPYEVARLVDFAVQNDFDVVYTYYDKKKHSLFRNLGSWFNGAVANILLHKPKDLYLSSFKIMNRFLVNEVIKYKSPFPYVDGLILQNTDHIGKVKVDHSTRQVGRSNYTIKKLIFLWLNMFTNFSVVPLRFSVILGFIFAVFGILFGVYSLIAKIINPDIVPGWTSLIISITIFSGIQLIAIGTIGEYVGRIFISQNKKPQFTIRKYFHQDINDDKD